jgi:hypothetical protein
MHECEGMVSTVERQVRAMQQQRATPITEIGALLDHARRLYLRQVDPNRICLRTGQPMGPMVEKDEVLPPFNGGLLDRLEEAIECLENAFDGVHPDDSEFMKNDLAHVPTEQEHWSWIGGEG